MREAGYHRIIITLFVTPVKVEPLLGWILLICNALPQLCNNPSCKILVRILSTVAAHTRGNTMACRECGKDEFLLLLLRVSTW